MMIKNNLILFISILLIAGCAGQHHFEPMGKGVPIPLPGTYTYEISSDPPGADIYLNEKNKGKTPLSWKRTLLFQTVENIEIRVHLQDHEQGIVSGNNYASKPKQVKNARVIEWGAPRTKIDFHLPLRPEVKLERSWQEAESEDTADAYKNFLGQYPQSKYSRQAEARLAEKKIQSDWENARKSDTIQDYENFLNTYPDSRFSEKARSRIEVLKAHLGAWQEAQEENSEKAYRNFVERHPESPFVDEALAVIADIEGRHVVDLIDEQKIELKAIGDGIQNMRVKVRKQVPYPITILFPVGSYFISGKKSTQNMVTTGAEQIHIDNDQWHEISVDVACANQSLGIPDEKDTFTVRRSPHQEELAQLIPVLDQAEVNYPTRQAAVWIVTDNASYAGLGSLVRRPALLVAGGKRIIAEQESARAMKICVMAGIDITQKRIWKDRQKILKGLENEKLRNWLKKKINE